MALKWRAVTSADSSPRGFQLKSKSVSWRVRLFICTENEE